MCLLPTCGAHRCLTHRPIESFLLHQVRLLHLMAVYTLPAMPAPLRVSTLLLLVGLALFLSPILSSADVQQRPANCSGRDPNSMQLRDELERAALKLQNFSLPVQVSDPLSKFNPDAFSTTGEETHYNTCLSGQEVQSPNTDISIQTLCPWTYKCDHDPARLPAYILHASCSSEEEEVQYSDSDGSHECQCRPMTYPLKVLRFVGCNPDTDMEEWELSEQIVNVGCRCIKVS